MPTTETVGVISTIVLEDPFIEKSGAIVQQNTSFYQSATISMAFEGQVDETRAAHIHSVTANQIHTPHSDEIHQPNKTSPYLATPSATKQALFRPPPISQLLFRVTHDQSMGCSPSGRAALPGLSNPYRRPLHNQHFDWRAWLESHGDFEKRKSIGTSFTSNFLHAFSIALCYRVEGKRNVTIIVAQRQFLTPGTCLKFDDLITWTKLPKNVFGAKKKNEYLVIGPIPPAAIVSRFTLENLTTLQYLQLFPNLHAKSMPTLELEELRQAMQSQATQLDSPRFNIAEHKTQFFLALLLGNQEGVCPHDRSTKLLVIHFLALAKGHVFRDNPGHEEFPRIEDFERKLDRETLSQIDSILLDIRMLQAMNKQRNVDTNERFEYKEQDFESAIKGWALNNPVDDTQKTGSLSTPSIPHIEAIPFPEIAPPQPTQPGLLLSAKQLFSSTPAPQIARPSTPTPTTTSPARQLEPSPLDCFTPNSSYPSPRSPYRSQLPRQRSSSPETPSKKRKMT